MVSTNLQMFGINTFLLITLDFDINFLKENIRKPDGRITNTEIYVQVFPVNLKDRI